MSIIEVFNSIEKTKEYKKDGKLHSENDFPSVIGIYEESNPKKFLYKWHKNGILHRINGPAVIYKTDKCYSEEWWEEGKLHRNECGCSGTLHKNCGPAIITENKMCWFHKGKIHKNYGPAIIGFELGSKIIE